MKSNAELQEQVDMLRRQLEEANARLDSREHDALAAERALQEEVAKERKKTRELELYLDRIKRDAEYRIQAAEERANAAEAERDNVIQRASNLGQ